MKLRGAGLRPALGQRGAILLVVLVLIAVVALGTSSLTLDTSAQQQRRNEEELLFVGEQYRQAIDDYVRRSPNGRRQFPTKLEDLVADNRFPQPLRHLRKLFRDPVNPNEDWVLIKVGNAIVGLHSTSKGVPFRKTGFSLNQTEFASASSYANWHFVSSMRVAINARDPVKPGAGTTPGLTGSPSPLPGR
ncbi:MAG: type II secretion system protein [Vitreoscilla sp.]|nr:type II secretion system protein [Burkholderiales bacterium]MBP6338483.1 type II secretion system protein [Vitreoscilla sp.]MBP6676187.1 type II secretion system protein [Vitreoscilla sp.]